MKNRLPKNAVFYQYTLTVTESNLDELNHVNNITYLKWVQDASKRHWDLLATKKIKKEVLWMVIRHEMDYHRQAFLNDEITIITWIGESKGVRSTRNVQFFKNDELLAACKTVWCLLDAATLRPKLIDEEINALLSNNH